MILQRQFETLAARWKGATLSGNGDGSHAITVPDLSLPPGWNRSSVGVAFVVPVGYPLAAPDCFWSEPGLALDHGGPPQNTGHNAGAGIPPGWLWFSWHPGYWDANGSNLETYLNVIRRRFAEVK